MRVGTLVHAHILHDVARGYVLWTRAIKQSWHTRHAPHKQTHHKHMLS